MFCLFQQIQCEVKAKYTTMKANPWSEPMSLLQPFFAGIKVKKLLFVEIPNPAFKRMRKKKKEERKTGCTEFSVRHVDIIAHVRYIKILT